MSPIEMSKKKAKEYFKPELSTGIDVVSTSSKKHDKGEYAKSLVVVK